MPCYAMHIRQQQHWRTILVTMWGEQHHWGRWHLFSFSLSNADAMFFLSLPFTDIRRLVARVLGR